MSALLLTVATSDVGRCDISSLSDLTKFELLVGAFDEKAQFTDENGIFKDLNLIEGLRLDSDSHIEGIIMPHNDFGGHFDMKFLPLDLKKLDLSCNDLSGEFSSANIPKSTIIVFLQQNELTGSVVLGDLPDSMKAFTLQSNALTGTLDFNRLPKNLTFLDLSFNSLSGAVDLRKIAKYLVTDITSPSFSLWENAKVNDKIFYLDLSYNKFEGNVLVFSIAKAISQRVFVGCESLTDIGGQSKKL